MAFHDIKFNKLVPELEVSDIQRSRDFYVNILGFKIEFERPENKFLYLSLEGSQLMIEQNRNPLWVTGKLEYPFGRGINLQIMLKNISPVLARLKKNKHPLKLKAHTRWFRKGNILLGTRLFLVLDPDGYLLRFSQDLGKKRRP